MAYHNHEENIIKAKKIIDGLGIFGEKAAFTTGDIVCLLKSMVEDAESGHERGNK